MDMTKFIWIILAFLATPGIAQESAKILTGFDPKTDIISDNYEAGEYLIYDCLENHWTCVSEPFYKECEEKREYDHYMKELHSRCAPLGQFPNKKSCFQRQLFMTSNNFGSKFCILNDWKQKELIFELR